MKLIFLGTGTSQGVPIIGCRCKTCVSQDSKDKRLRSSVYIQIGELHLVIDTGPDFRQQMLREQITKLDAILFTHDHKDHTAGLDDVRAFNFIQKKHMEVYAEAYVLDTLKREFSYAFAKVKYPGVPKINLNKITNKTFRINEIDIIPIRGIHFKLPVLGFRIENLAYITDMNFIENEELNKLYGLDVLVINALRYEKHVSHFNYEEALAIIEKVQPKKAYLTHVSHALGKYSDLQPKLPKNVFLSYDGLTLNI